MQRRIYFFWVVREKQALAWVQDALQDVQQAVWGREEAACDITIFYTGARCRAGCWAVLVMCPRKPCLLPTGPIALAAGAMA